MAKRRSGYVKSTSLKFIRSHAWYADTAEERASRKPLGKAKRIKPAQRTAEEQKLHDIAMGIIPGETPEVQNDGAA